MFHKILLTLTLTLITLTSAHAENKTGIFGQEDLYLYTGGWSVHTDKPSSFDEFNSSHDILIGQYKSWAAGYMENSFFNDTAIAGYHWSLPAGDFELGALTGISFGYYECFSVYDPDEEGSAKPCPMIAPMITFTKYDFQPTFIIIPGALAVSFRWKL